MAIIAPSQSIDVSSVIVQHRNCGARAKCYCVRMLGLCLNPSVEFLRCSSKISVFLAGSHRHDEYLSRNRRERSGPELHTQQVGQEQTQTRSRQQGVLLQRPRVDLSDSVFASLRKCRAWDSRYPRSGSHVIPSSLYCAAFVSVENDQRRLQTWKEERRWPRWRKTGSHATGHQERRTVPVDVLASRFSKDRLRTLSCSLTGLRMQWYSRRTEISKASVDCRYVNPI